MSVRKSAFFVSSIATGAAIFGFSESSHAAAITLTSPTSPATLNFGSFAGSAATLPAGFTSTNSGLAYGGMYSGFSSNNDIYAGAISSGDNAFIGRVPGGPPPGALTLTFGVQNNTGGTLNSLAFTYNVYSFQDHVTSNNTITLLSDDQTGGPVFDDANLTGGLVTTSENGTGATVAYPTPLLVATQTASYNQPLANGATVQFEFVWAPGSTGGNRPVWGVDNFSIAPPSPVPEPASLGMLALGSAGLFVRRRRGA